MTIYYAHSMFKYNTSMELQELKTIENIFSDAIIINPNGVIDQSLGEDIIMEKCLEYVKSSDIIVFSSINNAVGKGVFIEVNLALSLNKPVWYLSENMLNEMNSVDFSLIENRKSDRIYALVNKVHFKNNKEVKI